MIGKKINQLATELAPTTTDLTIIGDPISGVSKKITLEQLGAIFGGAVSFYTTLGDFPATGVIDIIYCAKDTKKLYLWSGSAYVEVFPSQSLLDTYQLRSEKGVSNGYASLDSGGKVPISQLPSSIMEYKGTWNAATNTPTLANGTGDTGDVYICNVAGTVNFGAGPLTFAVGDYVIYSGSIWQRSSGAVGTVTSVAATITGNSIGITGSPVTTSGTLALAFAGTSGQYINGAGNLTTFPTLTGYVPYTGATANVDLGTHTLLAKDLVINHSSGSGVAASITKGGSGEALTVVKSSGSGNAASITGGVTLLDELHLNTDLADAYIASASNWNAAYNDKINSASVTGTTTKTLTLTQQDGGTITASWTDDNTDAVTSVFGRTGAVVAVSGDYNTSQVTENTNLYFTNARAIASTLTGYTSGAGTISATDTILSAIQKLNGNIGALTTGVSSVNGLTGAVTLTTSNIAESTNLYYTEARVNANTNVAANTAARHNAVTIGTANGLSLSTQVLSLALASGSTTGALSSTDWTTFNNKQPQLNGTGFVKASGTTISYDNSTYLTTSSAASTYVPYSGATSNVSLGAFWVNTNYGYFTHGATGQDWLTRTNNTTGNYEIVDWGSTVARVSLTASGNLGLGVTPSAWTAYGPVFQIGNAGNIVSASGEISIGNNWYYNSGDKYVTSNFASFYQQLSGQHRWFNAPSGTAGNAISFTQAMTLFANGNLSVGNTTDAGAKLQVKPPNISNGGAANFAVNIESGTTTALNIYQGYNSTIAGQSILGTTLVSSDALAFATNNTERMRITSGGNVGIGTTSPNTIFSVVKAETVNAFTDFAQFSDNTNGLRISNYFDVSGIRWDFRRGTTSVISISQGNFVGIGTTSPSYKLDVSGTGRFTGKLLVSASSTDFIAEFINTASSTPYGVRVKDASSPANNYPLFSVSNNAGSVEYFRVNSGTGAATFSSSVTATQFTSQGGRGTSFGYQLPDWQIYNTSSGNNLAFSNYTVDFLTITSGGNYQLRNTVYSTSADVTTTTYRQLYPSGYNIAEIAVRTDGQYYAGAFSFRTADAANANVLVERLLIASTGAATFSSTIKTAAPTDATAQPWKLGNAVTGTCVPSTFGEFGTWFQGTVIQIEVNGTTYKIPAVIDNYC